VEFWIREVMDVNIPTTRRIRELIANGVITLGVHIARDGTDIWARAVQPHPRLGIQAHTSYTLEEIEQKLERVSTQSFKKELLPGSLRKFEENVGIGSLGYNSLEEATLHGYGKSLSETKRAGVTNKLPLDSLTPVDLDRSRKEIFARTCSVIDHLSTAKILSRISSQPDRLAVKGAHDLREWWDDSSPTQKLMLMMRSKHLPERGDGSYRIHGYWLDKLEHLPCPFREAEAQVGQKEGETSAKEEQASSSDENPASNTQGVSLTRW
jgi:hypothetical protein